MTRFDGPLSGEKITVVSADGPNVVIQDSDLLFTADYSRSGHDLILTGEHGNSVVVLDYFSQPDMPALSSPEGASLQPHVVSALAGPMAPGQYAQAGDQQPADSIGKVVTLEGSATAQRTDGTVVQLNVGDQVAQGDVLQTGDGSALGLVFVDGTVFSLSGASRMVLDNLVYQSGGSNNSLTFDVVQGTFSFVAGQVAPTGEMRIETPVASLGIRGTTPGGVCANGGPCTFFISPDPGTGHVGSFLLLGSAGQILQTINNPTFQYTVSASGSVVTEPLDPSVAEIINKLIQAFERRASEGEEKKEGEDGSGPNGGTDTANTGSSGIDSFSAASVTDSAIQTGLPTDGIEGLTEETTEPTTDPTTVTTASTSGTTTTGSTTGDTGTGSTPPGDSITDDIGTTVEDADGTTGTVDVSGAVVPQTGTEGQFGTFSIDQSGNWTYSLNDSAQALGEGDVAADAFTVTTENGATATVFITITGSNDAPVATADTVVGEFESSTTFTAAELLINDTDIDNPNGDLSIAGVFNGTGGVVVLNLDGSVTFTPDEGFSGTANFTYTVTDGIATSAPVTVSVTVEGSDAPVASPVTLAAIAEDSGARIITQAELLAGVTDPDGPSLTITALSIAEGLGTLIDNGNGTWTYTPAENDDTGVTFNYTVTDGTTPVSSTASLDITPVNDAPVASPVALTAIAEDSGARVITQAELLAGVTDIDSSGLTITALSIATGSGSLIDNGNGTWTYTPAANDDTGVTFNYTVTDGTTPVSSTASLDITPVNDAPVASPVTLTAIAENSGGRIITQAELLAGVTDPDGPSLTITALTIATGSGSLINNGNGTWTYTPAENDDTGVTFNYTVTDGTTPVSSTASLDITSVNQPPVLTGDLEADIANDSSYVLTADDLGFTDGDDTDVVFTVSNLVNGSILVDGDVASTFTYADIQNGLVSFQHDGSETSNAYFDVSVEDGNEDGSTPESQTFTLHVTNYITGTEGPDTAILNGTDAVDVINGLGDNDTLTGNGDDDILIGGDGADTYVWGLGDGNDTVIGDNLSQDIVRIEGGPFYDYNFEVDGDDLLVGVSVNGEFDWSAEGGGYLRIQDFFDGGDTIAYLEADLGSNNQYYSPGGGDSRIYFSAGTGTDQGNYFEVIIGTDIGETISDAGGVGMNRLEGWGGDDTLIASNEGSSILLGGNGNDTLIGGTNDDELRGGSGNDDIDGGDGYDTLAYHRPATSGAFTHGVFVNLSDDAVTYDFLGEAQEVAAHTALDNWWDPDTGIGVDEIQDVEAVLGTHFDDIIIGGVYSETISGGDGADILDGGVGEGYDQVSFYPPFGSPDATQGVFVNLSSTSVTYDFNGELDVTVGAGQALDNWGNTDTLSNFEDLAGSDLDDVLVAGIDDNYIFAGAGDDIIAGGGGFDYLVGGEGSDSFVFGEEWGDTAIGDFELGIDLLRFQGDVGIESYDVIDAIYDEFGDDDSTLVTLTTGATVLLYGITDIEDVSQLIAPPLQGDGNPNTLDGTVFNDVFEGGQGDDTLNGRAGRDIYIWSEDDGYDTVAANDSNEGIIQINGTFLDFDFEVDGNDLILGVANDESGNWAIVGGNLRLEDFLLGHDSIAYLEADLTFNENYSPGGGNARIYVSSVHGEDQGNYFELIVGTHGDDVMDDVGGGGINRFEGLDGNDTINVADGSWAVLIGGNDDDILNGADQDDELRGGSGEDTLDGAEGIDIVRYDRPSGSGSFSHGVFVNLSASTAVYDFNGDEDVSVLAGQAIDNWGDTDTLSNIEDVRGSQYADVIFGSALGNVIDGRESDDVFSGGGDVDTYIWRDGDGYDTILANDDNEDIIQINGSFYDYNYEVQGDDLLLGVTADDSYDFATVGGNLRLEDFFLGNDSIAYLEADLGDNNSFYSPEGGNARIYVSLINGEDQGNYYETILGTDGDDVMTDAGGSGVNRFFGDDGEDIITAADGGRAILVGGNDDDTLTGADMNDLLRGGNGNDNINGGDDEGDFGGDIVRYDRPAGSGPYTHGVVVNLSQDAVVLSDDPGEGEYYFHGIIGSVASNQAIGNWENLATWATLPANRVDTDTLSGIESVRGSTFDDILIGSDGDNNIIGDEGDDTIIGGGGDDFFNASFGSDYIDGGADYDHVWYGELDGVYVNLADGYADEGGGVVDILVNIEGVKGSSGVDTLIGDVGNNFFDGLGGNDSIDGGNGTDAVDFYGALEGVIVNLAEGTTSNDGYGGTDTLVSIEDIWGSLEHDDDLTGNFSANFIQGRGGNDTIRGYGGNDTLVGGEGSDIFVFGSQNDYTDTAQIEDFIVGEDYLRLEDGVSLNDIDDWFVGDFNGDDILDTRITIIDADNFEDGYIELLGVDADTDITDVNELFEPPSLFSMAFMAPEGNAGFDTLSVTDTGPGSQSNGADGRGGWSERGDGRSSFDRRGGEGRGHELAFAQVAAAVAGAALATSETSHAAVVSMPHTESDSQAHSAGGDRDIGPRSLAGHAFTATPDSGASMIGEAAPRHSGGMEIRTGLDIAGLRDIEAPAAQHSSTPEKHSGWSVSTPASQASNDSGRVQRAEHDGDAPAGAQNQNDAPRQESNNPHDAQPANGDWHKGSILDGAPLLDFSDLPVGASDAHAFAKGPFHQIEIKLPSFDSVIDLRHDLFAELPAQQNAAAKALEHVQDIRAAVGEWAHAAAADFVHNMANDLEAAVQSHDPR